MTTRDELWDAIQKYARNYYSDHERPLTSGFSESECELLDALNGYEETLENRYKAGNNLTIPDYVLDSIRSGLNHLEAYAIGMRLHFDVDATRRARKWLEDWENESIKTNKLKGSVDK